MTTKEKLTRQEKLFELLADKTLSFGCLIKDSTFKFPDVEYKFVYSDDNYFYFVCGRRIEALEIKNIQDYSIIIGHPITFFTVLKYLSDNLLLHEPAKGAIDVYNYLGAIWCYSKPDNLRHQPEAADFLCDFLGIT